MADLLEVGNVVVPAFSLAITPGSEPSVSF
jgi:hypothetical protein